MVKNFFWKFEFSQNILTQKISENIFLIANSNFHLFSNKSFALDPRPLPTPPPVAVRQNMSKYYPPGSKCQALRLGVHLIPLYFIRISILKIIFYFGVGVGVGVGVGGGLFLSLNLLIIIWYIV